MTTNDLRTTILSALGEIAPEANLAKVDDRADLREAFDLDSMDILRFATLLHARVGVDVPESDYGSIVTIDGCIRYLTDRAPTAHAGASSA